MDINSVHRADWERRRKIRLTQVRDQSKALAKTIRDRVHGAVEIQQERCETARNITEHKFKSLALNKLKSDFNYLIQDVGNGYSVASAQNNPSVVLAEKRLIDRCKAISRGAEAEKRQQQIQEKQQMDKDMRDRRIHFNKTVEKIRSKLITSVQNVDDDSTHKYNIKGHNECFLIPSQVTLNESNIMNQNFIRKPSKPWSMVISSKENQTKKLPQSTTYNENKENINDVSKFSKLETDMKTYETLILELKKLSAEEQNIRNKLFPNSLKEVPITCQNNVHLESQEKTQPKEINRKKQLSNGRIKSNEIKKQITEIRLNESSTSTSICISSSTSTSTNYEQPTNKTIRFEKENKKKNQQPSNKLNHKEKMSSGKPLQNINNTLQRIKNKKQLLVKEITAGTSVKSSDADIKKMKTVPTSFKSSPILKRCCAGGNSHKEIPVNYAQLPDSFYDNQLDILKEQVSKKKIKSLDFKSHVSINSNLMTYINTLLKMSPSDVDNLSISSCSSVKLEDSILQHSERDFYCKMLNCISKCLNSDISDINQDTEFTSPKNIKLLNRLQQLTDYYLEKTHEMKNICNESSQILSDTLNAKTHKTDSDTIKENSSINLSSDSSVDEEYILANLNKLLQKKGIINSDKEWPVFKHDDGDRSVTDQLLDIHPYKSHDM
ncbi:kinesin-related protein 8-like [Melanaphis sacchari]|uniref:kinesin-related protein 8-like n=1 Tax=Melanaphis sacchari TaxID=742174 RepID=UPI000DC146B8|nr:kinesin-related protein 8-like [Melanaphis sacchari]